MILLNEDFPTIGRYRVSLVCEAQQPYHESAPLADRPEAVVRLLRSTLAPYPYEEMGAIYLDVRHQAIAHTVMFRGALARTAVEPRGLLVAGLLRNAAGMVLWHSHPSGDPSPSAEDLAFTRRLAEAGDVVGVRLVDHIIMGDEHRWMSLKRQGVW